MGSLYGLIALGYTMVYGILQFINFAHSDIFMLGAWVSFILATYLAASGFAFGVALGGLTSALLILFCAMLICGVSGFLIERFAYRPLRLAPRLNVLITAIGVSLFLENVGQLPFVFGTQPQKMPALLPETPLLHLAGVSLFPVDAMVVVLAFLLMFALNSLIFHTRVGTAMRAVSQDTQVAALMGIAVDKIISITFVLGSMLAAAAGFFYAAKYPGLNQSAHATWILLGLKAFVAAVVGGIGNIHGAMLGGLLIGLLEFFGASYFSPHLKEVYVFSLLIIVLLLRPRGILGSKKWRKCEGIF